jgi:two-component system LytT family response regulator
VLPPPEAATLRVAIVDDEPLGRERIRALLAGETQITLAGEYSTGEAAVAGTADSPPDVIFLDVQMPGLDGFGVVQLLQQVVDPGQLPVIVFVTAYDEYALRAFEVSAVDYLLKPFDRARFGDALSRARTRVRERKMASGAGEDGVAQLLEQVRELRAQHDAAHSEQMRAEARFVVRSASKLFFVRAADVDWISSDGNYARLYTGGKTHLVRETLKSVESRLHPRQFVRVHRSAIINVDRVAVLQPHGHGEYVVTMKDGSRLTSSRAHSAKLRSLLNSG